MNRSSSFNSASSITILVLLGSILAATTGCRSTYPLETNHGKLPPAAAAREGVVLVDEFTDSRSQTNKTAMGATSVTFVVKDGRPVAQVLQGYFDEVLHHVGYQTQPAEKASVALEGDVVEFWGSGSWNHVVNIGVDVTLRDRAKGTVLWEKTIHGTEDDAFILPNAYRAAIDVFLSEAVSELDSQSFQDAVRRGQSATP